MRKSDNAAGSVATEYGEEGAREILGVSLDELGELFCGQSPTSTALNFEGRGWPYITGPEAWNGKEMHVSKWVEDPPRTVPDGCVFITVKGAGVGKLFQGLACAIGRDVYAFKPNNFIEYGYLMWALRSVIEEIKMKASGDIPGLSKGDLLEHDIPLFPLPEQRRIVAKLDALQSRTRIAREALDAVAPLLKSFRQSVLQAAVTGALTEEWRSKQRKLPEWDSILISDAGKIQLGRQRSPKYHTGDNMRPYLRVQNVFEDRLDLSDVMTMDFSPEDFERYRLVPGDILLNEGQSPELLGRPAMYRGELEGACFTNTLIRFQAYSNVESEYALLVFRHYMRSGKFRQEGTITTNIAHLGAGRFSSLDFPLPPLAEQTEIVRRVQHLFAMADAMEAEFAAAQRSVDQLDQSLLATAFRGELVPQDPSDEPASVLLERIRAARAALPEAKGKRGKLASTPLSQRTDSAAPKKRGRPAKASS